MKKIILFFLILAPLKILLAQEDLAVVAVGKAEIEKDKLLFVPGELPSDSPPAEKKLINEMQGLLQNDFNFYKQYFSVDESGSLREEGRDKKFSVLKEKGIRYLFLSSFSRASGGRISLQVALYDVSKGDELIEVKATYNLLNLRSEGHRLGDELYRKIKGRPSIFKSKILFVSDRNSRGEESIKELYIMDFDGKNPRRLTYHRGIVISPALSFDGKKVLYSLIRGGQKKRNINLYIMDLVTRKTRILSSRKGINSGAVFMPDGKHIALTMSHQGNAEIYALEMGTGKIRRITRHYAPDVDPSFNNDGTRMTFLSGRSGSSRPMIYVADPRGIEVSVKRRGFVGEFNATPRFSPDGKEIAFSSWMDNHFDIFRIHEDGSGLVRLTKDFGSNEDPTYSNDGQFIAFSGQRVLSRTKAVQNIYIMTRDGEILGQVTKGFGNCATPRWSKY